MESKLYDTETFLKNLDNTRNIAIIGRGEGNAQYKFNPQTVQIFAINDSCLFYPGCEWSVIVKAHFEKNYPIVNGLVPNILQITKPEMMKYELVTGCTPSILFSLLVKSGKLTGKNIYLQGFPLLGPSHDQKYPYAWDRQYKAFIQCFIHAEAYKVNLKFVTPSSRFDQKYHNIPEKKDIIL